MSGSRFSHPACHFAGATTDDNGAVRAVCRNALPGGACAIRDLMTLHALYASTSDSSPLSRPYFTDALMHFIARDCATGGAINDACARGITSCVSSSGAVNTTDGIDLLFHLLESDSEISDDLPQFVLEQIALALCEDKGAYGDMRPVNTRSVTQNDLRFINRVFKAIIKRGRQTLLPGERAVLLRIDDEVPTGAQHAAWTDLMDLVRQVPDDAVSPPVREKQPWLRLDDPRDNRMRAVG